jgi:sarcosine oxidase
MGSAACRALARRGHHAIGLEQFDIAHSLGSSHGESRLIRQAYFEHPDYVPLLKSAYGLWKEVERETDKTLFHRTGLVLFGRQGDSRILAGVRESALKHAIPIEALSGKALRKRFPLLQSDAGDEGILEPGAGYLEVENCVAAQAALAVRDGADIRPRSKVLGWKAVGDSIRIELANETLEVDRLIVTAGAWARPLLAELGVSLSLHRNLLFWYSAPEWFRTGPCFAFERGRNFFYGFPKRNAFGVKIANHVPGRPLERPEELSTHGWEADEAAVRNFLRETIPELEAKPSRVAACIYELSPDENFIVDRHPTHSNVVVGAGFSGHGFKFSPVIGEALADLAEKGRTDHPIGFLGLSRFRA